MLLRPLSRLQHPREVVRQFTPNWFTATMGTGILALALNQFPIDIAGLKSVAQALWFANIGLFGLCSALYCARWVFFFDGARRIFQHSVMCMFFGAIPMGLATIINGFRVFGPSHWGSSAVEVTAASGGLLVGHLPAGAEPLRVMFLSYVLWGTSVLPAFGILVILFLRMVLHKLPKRDMAVSSWLSIGPIGTGALGLLLLGERAPRLLAGLPTAPVGVALEGIGV